MLRAKIRVLCCAQTASRRLLRKTAITALLWILVSVNVCTYVIAFLYRSLLHRRAKEHHGTSIDRMIISRTYGYDVSTQCVLTSCFGVGSNDNYTGDSKINRSKVPSKIHHYAYF